MEFHDRIVGSSDDSEPRTVDATKVYDVDGGTASLAADMGAAKARS